jgi:multidrug efflux pump subunit AcrA (membrane-fusion protein)
VTARRLHAALAAAALALLVPAAASRAADADLTLWRLERAQAAHDRGVELRKSDPAASLEAFREAAREWDRARRAGAENGPLEFNLGNAWLEAGDLGQAIAAYRRAERFLPGNADLAHNLALARSRVTDSVGGGTTVLVDAVASGWHVVPAHLRANLGIACWAGFWAIVAARALVRPRPQPDVRTALLRAATVATGAGAFVLGGTAIADALIRDARPPAVLLETGTVLRKGNGDGFEPAFVETLGPGVECTVVEARPGWVRLALPDGRTGWVRDSQVVLP